MAGCGWPTARQSPAPRRPATAPTISAFLRWSSRPTPTGDVVVITDNLSSHTSVATREWLAGHPRLQQVFIPNKACWLNLQEGWWRLFRRQALAGQCFADAGEITLATRVAMAQLNARARPWVWGRPHCQRATDGAPSSTEFKERSTTELRGSW
jgi:hypothetical protein